MFNRDVNKKLMEKVGLSSVLSKYGSYEYLHAMDELRVDIMFKMRSENLKSHMLDRNLKKKDRLIAYAQYFVEDELRSGIISSRFS